MTNRFFSGQTDYIEQLNALDGETADHIADTTGAHAATAISNTPAGNIAATTVQAAINELDSEKLSASATALPSSFASASINSITPTGGTLSISGAIQLPSLNTWALTSFGDGNFYISRPGVNNYVVVSPTGLSVTGSISATSLVDISAAGAGQIKFPATQNASADANTLDDYEEGSWAPTITFGGASTGVTYSTQGGSYTKVGNRVTVSGRVALTNKGSATGDAAIGGLPFTVGAGSDAYAIPGLYVDVITFTGIVQGATTLASTSIFLGQSTEAGASSALTDANFANNSNIAFSLTYKI